MKQEIAKLEELIKQELKMVKNYDEKPAYYLQVNKSECRLLIRVDDIPKRMQDERPRISQDSSLGGKKFENGSTEMTVSGIVKSDKVAVVEKLTIKYK